MPTIDLNADLGEERGDDASLLAIVTTANVAAGAHAGGGPALARTVREAARRGVNVGAHISYADRVNFGRVSHAHEPVDDLVASLIDQIAEVHAATRRFGVLLTHVKAHGALYNDAAAKSRIAEAIVYAVQLAAEQLDLAALPVLGLPVGAMPTACQRAGVPFVAEAFADRAYDASGELIPRDRPGAVLTQTADVVAQALSIALHGRVRAINGGQVPLTAGSICVHGDSARAVVFARGIRDALLARGVRLQPFTA